MIRHPMTLFGHKMIQEEIHRLKAVERPRIILAIEEARAHGDLSENAEYNAAKEEQGLSEAKLRDLEGRLSTAQVVDVTTLSGSKVIFGATVTIADMDSDDQKTLMIVGEHESDAENGLISFSSPLARGLIGKEIGDTVRVRLPGGEREYEILDVEFKEPRG